MSERYAWGAQDLSRASINNRPAPPRRVELKRGMVLEDLNGWVGEVVRAERIGGEIFFGLEDAHGRVKNFPLGIGYFLEGKPVEIVAPTPRKTSGRKISRSGSVAVENAPARVARASRIWVEGLHDAELVEKVWGHDLRITRPKLITSRHRDTPITTPQPHTGALFMPSYPGGYTTESHRQGRQENHALGTTPNRIYHLADSFRKSRIHHRNTHPLDPIPRPHLPTRVRPDRHRKPSNPMARKPELETSHEEKRPAIHPLILSLSHRYRTTRRRPNPPDTLYTTTQV